MPKVVMLVSMAASNWSLVPGDVAEVNEEVAHAWEEHGIAKPYVQEKVKVVEHNTEPIESVENIEITDPNVEVEIKHVGGGWYQLPNGEKVQGKDEAQEALKELQGSDE